MDQVEDGGGPVHLPPPLILPGAGAQRLAMQYVWEARSQTNKEEEIA